MTDEEQTDETEVQWRMGFLRARYGNRFKDPNFEQDVRKQVAHEVVRVSKILRAFNLKSSQEPFPPFKPYRSDD